MYALPVPLTALQSDCFPQPLHPRKLRGETPKKKQNCFITADLLPSALILLSLCPACTSPFALAQSRSREAAKRSGPVNTSRLKDSWHGSVVVHDAGEHRPGPAKFQQFDYPAQVLRDR